MKKNYLLAIILLAFSIYMGCKKDENKDDGGDPCPGTPTVAYEGQVYNTVLIGHQCWFKENLNVGNMIKGKDDMTDNGVIEKYCYDNDPANCNEYGGLYQWNEMMEYSTTAGEQGICPSGWHLPTDGEWTIMANLLGGAIVAGGKMKETGTTHWLSPNTGATNESGFTALPGGHLVNFITMDFYHIKFYAFFWSSTVMDSLCAIRRRMTNNDNVIFRVDDNRMKAYSVRCIKD